MAEDKKKDAQLNLDDWDSIPLDLDSAADWDLPESKADKNANSKLDIDNSIKELSSIPDDKKNPLDLNDNLKLQQAENAEPYDQAAWSTEDNASDIKQKLPDNSNPNKVSFETYPMDSITVEDIETQNIISAEKVAERIAPIDSNEISAADLSTEKASPSEELPAADLSTEKASPNEELPAADLSIEKVSPSEELPAADLSVEKVSSNEELPAAGLSIEKASPSEELPAADLSTEKASPSEELPAADLSTEKASPNEEIPAADLSTEKASPNEEIPAADLSTEKASPSEEMPAADLSIEKASPSEEMPAADLSSEQSKSEFTAQESANDKKVELDLDDIFQGGQEQDKVGDADSEEKESVSITNDDDIIIPPPPPPPKKSKKKLIIIAIAIVLIIVVGAVAFKFIFNKKQKEEELTEESSKIIIPKSEPEAPKQLQSGEHTLGAFYLSLSAAKESVMVEMTVSIGYKDKPDSEDIKKNVFNIRDAIYLLAQGYGPELLVDTETLQHLEKNIINYLAQLLGKDKIDYVKISFQRL